VKVKSEEGRPLGQVPPVGWPATTGVRSPNNCELAQGWFGARISKKSKVRLYAGFCAARCRAVAIIPLGPRSRVGSSHLPAASPSQVNGCLFGVAPRRDCPFHPRLRPPTPRLRPDFARLRPYGLRRATARLRRGCGGLRRGSSLLL